MLALVALAGCQTAGSGPGSGPVADGMVATCAARAAAQFNVPGDDVATSNEYAFGAGNAIDGSVTAGGGIKQFRCEFDAAGAFQRVAALPAA
jgi:hypothetical protein